MVSMKTTYMMKLKCLSYCNLLNELLYWHWKKRNESMSLWIHIHSHAYNLSFIEIFIQIVIKVICAAEMIKPKGALGLDIFQKFQYL